MNSVCVFCGSSPGARPSYLAAAEALGREVARRGWTLVYGGAHVGLMGAVADAALAAGGRVFGVIPDALRAKEVAHEGLTELFVVPSMHERKAKMASLSDGFVALPGGLGTLDELFEAVTWTQLGVHEKPCGLLDVDGYFDGLVRFLDHAVEERFVAAGHRSTLLRRIDAAHLLDAMSAWSPSPGEKWLDRSVAP